MANLMNHVEYLSETIGARPATTDAEERAANYIRDAFEARGLDAEVQHFDSPRTDAWAFVIYHLLTIAAALLARVNPFIALVLGAAVAITLRMDLDTRWGLTRIMPKGPSQNVIARHVPRSGRNERVAKVVVVAHYDSARTSLAFAPGPVKNFSGWFRVMKWSTYLVPVLILVRMLVGGLPFAAKLEPWMWYAVLVPAAYLLIPLFVHVHRELFMPYSPGANDNASGVAAMLGAMDRLVPEPDAATLIAREAKRERIEEEARDTDLLPEGTLLNYAPIAAPAARGETWSDDEDISWDTGVISGQTSLGLESPASRPARAVDDDGPVEPSQDESMRLFGTAFPSSSGSGAARPARDPMSVDLDLDDDTASFEAVGHPTPAASDDAPHRANLAEERRGLREWLGLGGDFDARRTGREIGSWDNFGADDDEDAGWKGGAASVDDPDDPEFTASIVSRIRRKVTMNVDRDLVEKEVWFVATGAAEVGTTGMQALLATYGFDLKDAAIINLDNLGTGNVSYITGEGIAKRYAADRRLVGATRRAVREADLPVRGREYRGLSTDATSALARGYRAMSIMAFDINGRLQNWHWKTDVASNVNEENLETAVDLVSAIIKEL